MLIWCKRARCIMNWCIAPETTYKLLTSGFRYGSSLILLLLPSLCALYVWVVLQTFRRYMLLPSSGEFLVGQSSGVEEGGMIPGICCQRNIIHNYTAIFAHPAQFNPENGGSMYLQRVRQECLHPHGCETQ
jgi:hypothetical protein